MSCNDWTNLINDILLFSFYLVALWRPVRHMDGAIWKDTTEPLEQHCQAEQSFCLTTAALTFGDHWTDRRRLCRQSSNQCVRHWWETEHWKQEKVNDTMPSIASVRYYYYYSFLSGQILLFRDLSIQQIKWYFPVTETATSTYLFSFSLLVTVFHRTP